ncbi:glycoside hydrolase family 2 TIM barrel-domain containing protein [Asticcacaulis sp.]|uniref:glycoside hydrolase family 2 TIM barrel-domain containing protein n=1 Tax=Asticcacaulis sp. TaxID=1872648 RepID=UPI0026371124|nr:glycoside hydrolase family 2 TIM barrel-domain containing protein [Asticcacaulis sp.]
MVSKVGARRVLCAVSVSCLALLAATGGQAQTAAELKAIADAPPPDVSGRAEWEQPEVLAVNRLPMKATFFNYESVDKAVAGQMAASANYLTLDGTWKFALSKTPETRPVDFYKPDFDVSGWGTVQVPGILQAQGYGVPLFSGAGYPFGANEPYVRHEVNEVGSYRRDFELPNWSGKDVFLHIGAAGAAYYIWVNGQKVGYSEDSKLPSEFDLTPYVRAGKNTISIELYRYADGSYLEDQDFWRLSGIERSVYLYAEPKTRLGDYTVTALLDKTYTDGVFALEAELKGVKGAGTITATLYDGETVVLTARGRATTDKPARLSGTIKNVRQWSAETPNLYRMVIEYRDTKGVLVSATAKKIGFRTIEIRDGEVQVNGKRVMIKGVNRHEHDPYTFRVVSPETTRKDMELMKQAHVNALRMSHYPNDPHVYDLADEYGLYVMDEANIESHTYMAMIRDIDQRYKAQLGYKPHWYAAHLDRVSRMVERDKNVTSVVFWSLGNEAGIGPAFERAAKWVRGHDKTRLLNFLGYGTIGEEHRSNAYVDIYAPMYDSPVKMADYAKDSRYSQPMIQCEYAHAMGNSLGNLEDYWETIRAYKKLQGGFIWDWVDQAVIRKDAKGRDYWAQGFDFPTGEWQEDSTIGDGVVQADRTPDPEYYELQKVYSPVVFEGDPKTGTLTVVNRNDLIDLSGYAFGWKLEKDGVTVKTGTLTGVNAPAAGRTAVPLDLGAVSYDPAAEYVLTVSAVAADDRMPGVPKGSSMGWTQFVLQTARPAALTASGPVKVTRTASTVELSAGPSRLTLDAKTGLLTAYAVNGQVLLSGGTPYFWRGPTDNDIGTGVVTSHAIWKTLSEKRTLETLEVSETGEVKVGWRVGAGSVRFTTSWHLYGDGTLDVKADYVPLRDDLPDPLRVGLKFATSPALTDLQWYGRGPQESYADRKTGAAISLYQGKVADQYHNYTRPQESGNKTDVRWMALTTATGQGVRVTGHQPLSANALAFPVEDLYQQPVGQRHSSDIAPHGDGTLMIDALQTGVGGDTGWNTVGRPHVKYRIPNAPLSYGFTLSPVSH